MPTAEKFCLRWNDFQENVNTAFSALRNDIEFTDVTLACQNGYQVDAHKVILAASSPFFQNMLKNNKHSHPLIYMTGWNFEDLLAIVDFLYHGEANIYEEHLDRFLKIAEEIKLKGLNGGEGGREPEKGNAQNHIKQTNNHSVKNTDTDRNIETVESNIELPNIYLLCENPENSNIAVAKQNFSGNMKELDELIETMMGKSENMIKRGNQMIKAYVCQVCGKEDQKINIKYHIEANHIEGVCVPCNLCEKSFSSRNSLRVHVKTQHTIN